MTDAMLTQWVRAHVHECAPNHSTQVVEVGFLRNTAEKTQALCEALEIAADTLHAITMLIRHEFDGDGKMHWMRDPTEREADAVMQSAKLCWEALRLEAGVE